MPGLAEKWEQAADDKKTWIFHLRRGVKFHDGTDFTADAVIWNLDRYFKKDSTAIRAAGVGHLPRARAADGQLQEDRRLHGLDHHQDAGLILPVHGGLSADHLAELIREGRQGVGKVATLPAPAPGRSGSPRSCRASGVDLVRNDGYWDPAEKAKLDAIRLIPLPEATARMAALRRARWTGSRCRRRMEYRR